MEGVVDVLPPIDAPLAQGEGSVQVVPDPEAPFVGMVFKILYDTYLGATTYVRVYQGSLKRGSPLLNVNRGMKERAMRMLRMHANKPEDVDVATAGDILAFVGLKKSKTGDTLVAGGKKVLLEQLAVPEPVIGVVIEPRSKADADTLETALQRLSMEDPSFRVQEDPESGQTVIYGMGELHLEIIVDRLTREHKAKANFVAVRHAPGLYSRYYHLARASVCVSCGGG